MHGPVPPQRCGRAASPPLPSPWCRAWQPVRQLHAPSHPSPPASRSRSRSGPRVRSREGRGGCANRPIRLSRAFLLDSRGGGEGGASELHGAAPLPPNGNASLHTMHASPPPNAREQQYRARARAREVPGRAGQRVEVIEPVLQEGGGGGAARLAAVALARARAQAPRKQHSVARKYSGKLNSKQAKGARGLALSKE